MSTTVTVLVTCHNEERYIAQAIESAANQSAFNIVNEIIVVDDGSSDGSGEILAQLAKRIPRLRPFSKSASGLPAARNFGIAKATGDLIAFLDGDDFWDAQKLERQLPTFAANDRVALVYSDFMDFTKDDASDAQLVTVRSFRPDNERTLADYFVHDAPIVPSTAVIRKSAFADVGLFDPSYELGEDTELCLRLAERWRFAHVKGGLAYKRRHKEQLTNRLDALLPIAAAQTQIFIKRNPELAPLAGKRMARRYSRAGNDCVAKGERAKGARYLLTAMRLDPLYWRIYLYLALLIMPGRWLRKLAKSSYHLLVITRRRFSA